MSNVNFAKTITNLIESNSLNQLTFANAVKVNQSQVSDWISGKSKPSFEALRDICIRFNISADYLLGLKEDEVATKFKIANRRYTGSKLKLKDWIKDLIIKNCFDCSSFCDIFAGTGVITDILLKILAKKGNLNNVSEQLWNLSNTENLSTLYDAVNIAKLKQVLSFLENNMQNDDEEDWQKFFKKNQWVISQLFSYPATIFADKAYLGGKNSLNKDGKIVDFLYANDLSRNVALVEIKTPKTKLLGTLYRTNIFAMSENASGGINQLLRYKDTLLKDWKTVFDDGENVIAFNPSCILIIGNSQELVNKDKRASFELWRSSLNGILVITFDELKQKIENLIKAFCE